MSVTNTAVTSTPNLSDALDTLLKIKEQIRAARAEERLQTRAAAKAQAQARAKERREVVRKVRALMKAHGIVVEDLIEPVTVVH